MSLDTELSFLLDIVRLTGHQPVQRIVSPAKSLVYLAGKPKKPVIVKISYDEFSDEALKNEMRVLQQLAGHNGAPLPMLYLENKDDRVFDYYKKKSASKGIPNPVESFFHSQYTFISQPSVLVRPYIPGHTLYDQNQSLTASQKEVLLDEMLSFHNAGYSNLDLEEWHILIDKWGRPRPISFGSAFIRKVDGDEAFFLGVNLDHQMYEECCSHKQGKTNI